VDQQRKECKGSHRAGLVKVVSCFGYPGQERRQSIFYFSDETNLAMGYVNSFVLLWYCFIICSHVIMLCFRWGGPLSTERRDIDGKYLDVNEAELKAIFQKWRNECYEHGVSIMCDSWSEPTRMSVINFLLYSNGRLWFHLSIDATKKSQALSSYWR
jgi:hypothetical protein